MADQIHFILNDRTICTCQPLGVTALDYLRLSARLTATKEGCKEGGCGACTVLLGELQGDLGIGSARSERKFLENCASATHLGKIG